MAGKDRTKPTTPTGLKVVPVGPRQVDLSWNASRDPVVKTQETSGIRGYRIFRLGQSIGEVTGIDALTYSDRSVEPDSTYRYAVAAVDRAGNQSPLSADVSVRTPAESGGTPGPDITPPNVPSGVTVKQS